ncbi:SH3 domain-containing protein [Anaerolineales bacterium HSG25]|nr:SH3 domain-containing protein [Anaerolineales bacterium HSG25]
MIIDQQTPTRSFAPRRRTRSIGSDIHSAQGKAHVRVFSFLLLVMLIGLMLAGCNIAQPAPIEQATEVAEVAPTDSSEPATQESTVVPESTATSESTDTPEPTATSESTATQASTATLVSTDTPEPTATLVPPTDTPEPTNTLVPTITPSHTPTEIAIPMVGLKEADFENINLRSGPSTDYPVLGQFNRADLTELLGQNETKDWLQIDLDADGEMEWVFADLIMVMGNLDDVPVVETPLPPPPTETPDPTFVSLIDLTAEPIEMEVVETEEVSITEPETTTENEAVMENEAPPTSEELANDLRCGKDFCVTYQTLMSKAENGGCIGNHSIYITVLQGPPPGQPMDGVVLGDTYNNVEVGSGSHGPGRTEITLWSNSMTLYVKRNMDGTPYTSEESFNFTTLDELIPADALAVAGYCEGNVEKCEWARNHNQVCRGHYSWRVTFHKFD